jgi:hypothetical protein
LRSGDLAFLRSSGDILAFERRTEADRLLCLFNLGGAPQRYRASGPLLDAGFESEGVQVEDRTVRLPPWGFAFAHID